MNLYRILATVVIQQVEMFAGGGHQQAFLIITDVSGCTATPVQLMDWPGTVKQCPLTSHLGDQSFQIRHGSLAIGRDDFVAGAVVTDRAAEGQMKIQRQRTTRRIAALNRLTQRRLAKALMELWRRRVGRVTGARQVVALDQLTIPDSRIFRNHCDKKPVEEKTDPSSGSPTAC